MEFQQTGQKNWNCFFCTWIIWNHYLGIWRLDFEMDYQMVNWSFYVIVGVVCKFFIKYMDDKFQYRLSKGQKSEIAQNLIDILQKDASITKEAKVFIGNWILTDCTEKRKAFFDVWDIVLRNYLPATRPVLFRACGRINKVQTIASFTGRLECARRFSEGKGSLIICDTKEMLQFEEEFYKPGDYKHTFYPLVTVLQKAKEGGGWGFSESLLNRYVGEDEYIMRINLGRMSCLKWVKND